MEMVKKKVEKNKGDKEKLVARDTMMQHLIKEAVSEIQRRGRKLDGRHYKQLRKAREWCGEHKHPEARIGDGEKAPRDHLYCDLCNTITYDPDHPAYQAAKKRSDVNDSYEP